MLTPRRSGWPREESNLRARIRSPPLYPLSYGAVRPVCQSRSWFLDARPLDEAAAILKKLAVAVAQLVEPRVVVPVVAGSSPVRHPS